MADIPESAVRAAAGVRARQWDRDFGDAVPRPRFVEEAREILEAAAPVLAGHVRREVAAAIRAQQQPCPVPFHKLFPGPSCRHCGRNGAFELSARIAEGIREDGHGH